MAKFSEVIPPGQVGEITLEIAGEKISGNFSKNASVTTNDPRHPQLTISLSGKIIPYVQVEPSNRIYLRGMYGESVSKERVSRQTNCTSRTVGWPLLRTST